MDKIKDQILTLLDRASKADANDAVQLSQAACNAVHVLRILNELDRKGN